MHVRQRFAHLVYVFSGFFFAKPATLSQTVKQLTLRRPLENEVDLLVVVEETIHLQYVLVVEMALDFNLTLQLSDAVVLDQLPLVKDFNCNYKLRLLLPRKVYLTEFAASKR